MTRIHAADDASRAASEAAIFRAFVQLDSSELTRAAIMDAAGLGSFSPAQSNAIARIDKALRALVAAKRLVRVRTGLYSVIGRGAAG